MQDMVKDCPEGITGVLRRGCVVTIARDGFCCMLIGDYDISSLKKYPALKKTAPASFSKARTECCHVLSLSTLQKAGPENPKHEQQREHASSGLTILERFGLGSFVVKMLERDDVRHLSNNPTLSSDLHDLFANLHLWLEGTGNANEYIICGDEDIRTLRHLPQRTVTFKNYASPRDLPLPDPTLLALHATCARVFCMSGADDYYEKMYEDAEELLVLAADGSSADILAEQMKRIPIADA
ncbi:hypothetical protein VKT23_019927 [Stygiomarasmius scandens]|uniref:Uncharacterized protein n=1 Tax=Marasmiellus scandens TaxID=2682957 RepID=A0ABR1IKE5_9AGAR